MNWVDLVVFGIIIVSGLLGMLRGLVREVLGLAAWGGALLAAITFFQSAQPIARRMIANPDIADPAAYAAVFLIALIVLTVIANIIGSLAHRSALGGVNRTLGLVFGVVRGAVVLIVAYIVVGMGIAIETWPPPVLAAHSLPYVYRGAIWVADRLPPSARPTIQVPPAPGGADHGTGLGNERQAPADDIPPLPLRPFGHPSGDAPVHKPPGATGT